MKYLCDFILRAEESDRYNYFFIMPENPDTISAPMELINGFRLVAFFTSTVFWFTLALILGTFWQKTNPDLSNT